MCVCGVCVCVCLRVYLCECVSACVCVGAGARLMSTEQQLFFPSENVQANPNRPALNATAPHSGLRIHKLNRIQKSGYSGFPIANTAEKLGTPPSRFANPAPEFSRILS